MTVVTPLGALVALVAVVLVETAILGWWAWKLFVPALNDLWCYLMAVRLKAKLWGDRWLWGFFR